MNEETLLSELDMLLGNAEPGDPVPAGPALAVGGAGEESAAPPASAAPPVPSEPADPVGPARILVVDDNKDYREVVKYILEEKGYEVATADNGAQGLVQALNTLPDLVLLDFNMPEKNGYEVIQELRSNDETRGIAIVLFTGAPNKHNLMKMGLDVQGFILKPVSNAKLLEDVEEVLKKRGKSLTGKEVVPEPGESEFAPVSEVIPGQKKVVPFPLDDATGSRPGADPIPNLEDIEKTQAEEAEKEEQVLLAIEGEDVDAPVEEVNSLELMAQESPLVNRVNKMLIQAVNMGASDIHIEPQEKDIRVRVRLNGSLQTLSSLPSSLGPRLAARIKIMSELSITERRRPQDGQFRAVINEKKTEFRVSTLPNTYGEKIVMRVLGTSKIQGNLGTFGLPERDLDCMKNALKAPNGLILATGPTGSGKTTTLYTMLSILNNPDTNILTAEDPVEYRLAGISQTNIKSAIGLTFDSVLRAFLRQDPDVMLVGEIRDIETAEIAVKASITGHLVLSTLHTNGAAATVVRLTDMGLAPYLVAASVRLIIAQRLVRLLCPDCKIPVPPSDEEKRLLAPKEMERLGEIHRGVGCPSCHQTGYTGRKPIFEVMPLESPEMRDLVLQGGNADKINALAAMEGMTSLRWGAINAVADGEVSLSDALKVILTD